MVILLRRSAGTSSITTRVPDACRAVSRSVTCATVSGRAWTRRLQHRRPGGRRARGVVAQERQRPEALGVLEHRDPGAGHAGSAAWIAREPTTQCP